MHARAAIAAVAEIELREVEVRLRRLSGHRDQRGAERRATRSPRGRLRVVRKVMGISLVGYSPPGLEALR